MRNYIGGEFGKFQPQGPRKVFLKRAMAQMAYGLWSMHKLDVLYGDFKEGNIFCEDKQCTRLVLGDFGLCTPLCKFLCTGKYQGTPLYMAPAILKKNRSHGVE